MAAKKYGAMRDLVKSERDALGLSQAGFANHISGNLPTLQRWESGTASPGGLMTARLIKAGVSVDDLIKAFEKDAAETVR